MSQKIESWTHYNEWGEITHNMVLKCGQRELDLVKNYTGHDYVSVLSQYYAKARMYDAGDRRFTSVDPIKGNVEDPLSLVQYLYVKNGPLVWVDPLGLVVWGVTSLLSDYSAGFIVAGSMTVYRIWDDNGNEAVIMSSWIGAGSPNVSASVISGFISGADTIFDFVYSESVSIGGSAGVGSADVLMGETPEDKEFYGISFGAGAGLTEGHIGNGYASIYKVTKRNGQATENDGRDRDYYMDLSCDYQEAIAKDLNLPEKQQTPLLEENPSYWYDKDGVQHLIPYMPGSKLYDDYVEKLEELDTLTKENSDPPKTAVPPNANNTTASSTKPQENPEFDEIVFVNGHKYIG